METSPVVDPIKEAAGWLMDGGPPMPSTVSDHHSVSVEDAQEGGRKEGIEALQFSERRDPLID